MATIKNIDCIIEILKNLSINDREQCRQISTIWNWSANCLALIQSELNIQGYDRHYQCRKHLHLQQRQYRPQNTIFGEDVDDNDFQISNNNLNTIKWPYPFIRYQCYCLMLKRFPNLRTIRFESINHWNDHMIEELIINCPRLQSISFIQCHGVGRSRMDESNHINLTYNGWQRMITIFGQQIHTLILKDCQIDERQLAIIINGFRQLIRLDITDNRLEQATALRDLSSTIRSLSLGNYLSSETTIINDNHNHNDVQYIPILSIVSGPGCQSITELFVQGYIDNQFPLIERMKQLQRLTIHFWRTLFDEHDSIQCLSSIRHLSQLRCLEIYHHNTHDTSLSMNKEVLQILRGCPNLERFVFDSKNGFECPFNDRTFEHMREYCPKMTCLAINPGDFSTTNNALQILSTFPQLQRLQLIDFPSINQLGILALLNQSKTITDLIVRDCCHIEQPEKFIQSIIDIHRKDPLRRLNIQISQSSTSYRFISSKPVIHSINLPENNPNLTITISQPLSSSFSSSSSSSSSSILRQSKYFQYAYRLFDHSNYQFIQTILTIPDIILNGMKILSTLTIISLVFILYFLQSLYSSCMERSFSFGTTIIPSSSSSQQQQQQQREQNHRSSSSIFKTESSINFMYIISFIASISFLYLITKLCFLIITQSYSFLLNL